MSLEINTAKAIKFGDKSFTPKINAEQMLRLQRAKMTTEGELEDLKKNIALCFGDDKLKVAEYLEHVDFYQLALIQAYLVGGDEMVQTIRKNMSTMQTAEKKGGFNG
jgi:hypothetical protein